MATLAEIKAKLLEQQNKGKGGGERQASSGGDNALYPFWNIGEGQTCTLRFLPDKDPNNTFFWVKREVIKLPFSGVEGGDYPTNKDVTVTVPCVEMWGDTCPIISETRPWWKDGREELARLYWKKKTWIFQGFVVNSPFEEANRPENPIRRFAINKQIFEKIERGLMDPELEDLPTDYVGGLDFKVEKSKQGQFASYSNSNYGRRPRSLSEEELIAIEQHGLFDLKEYLGRRPDSDELAAIKQMFRDSVDGKPFDAVSFGKYYRAFGAGFGGGNGGGGAASSDEGTTARTPAASTPAASDANDAPAAPAASAPAPADDGAKPNAHEILARIKNRTMNKA